MCIYIYIERERVRERDTCMYMCIYIYIYTYIYIVYNTRLSYNRSYYKYHGKASTAMRSKVSLTHDSMISIA